MKTVLKVFSGLFAAFVVLIGIIYFIYPGLMISAVQALSANGAGLIHKSIDIDGYTAHYYEGGDKTKPTIILLHGLHDDKNSFVTSIRELTHQYHIVLPDLQAHGDNKKIDGPNIDMARYNIAGQASFINQLSDRLGITQFVIGGNSMGGHIAGAFASRYPNKTRGLVVLNGAGMQVDTESVYRHLPNSVDIRFFTDSFERSYVTPPKYPQPVLQHLVNKLNPTIEFMNKLIQHVEAGDDFRMNEKVRSINAPALVIWGQHDPSMPLSYAQLYANNLPTANLIVIENAGHSPQFETPERVQTALAAFMQTLN